MTKTSNSQAGRKPWKKVIILVTFFSLFSTYGWSQFVVTDFYNGIINTVSQVIQSASKIINSEAFKHTVKIYEKLKEVKGGVQQFKKIQEVGQMIQLTATNYKKALDVISEDRHFTASEIQEFYTVLSKLTKEDSKILENLQIGIQANVLEMTSAERLEFIMKIHDDATASVTRISEFVLGLEALSMRRCVTVEDKLATRKLYSLARGTHSTATANEITFGNYEETGVDIEDMEERATEAAKTATREESEWMSDPNNPQAKETAMRNIINDPMPQRPTEPKLLAKQEEKDRYIQLLETYPDRLEYWQASHEKDIAVLGSNLTYFVSEGKPSELTEKEWMEVLMNKLRKGQL